MDASRRRAATGIRGFDAIAAGGLPRGRVTVLLGTAGGGKTLFALETLARGAAEGEPGLFVAFEEDADDVIANAQGFEWGLDGLRDRDVGFLDARLSETVLQGGDFDLLALLAMLDARATEIGAQRVVFDGLDVLLDMLSGPDAVRREVWRIRDWLRRRELTGLVTAKVEGASGRVAERYEFLQFLADCVVELRHLVHDGMAERRLRIAKYRGAPHVADEFSFGITERGLEVAAEEGYELREQRASEERISTGVEGLDEMLGGGYYRGSSVLVSGAPGTAKTTLAGAFAAASCARGERVLFVSFDESGQQILRNLRSVGIDLAPYEAAGQLRLHALRSRTAGATLQLQRLAALYEEHAADHLILDPISALQHGGTRNSAENAALRLTDLVRVRGGTVVSTSLVGGDEPLGETSPLGLSTIADCWMHLSYTVQSGERNRALTIVKSRGMRHSNQLRELILHDRGVDLADVYTAGGEVLFGTLRWEREREEQEREETRRRETWRRCREAEIELAETRARVERLQWEQRLREEDLAELRESEETRRASREAERHELERRRGGREAPSPEPRD